MAEIQVWAHRGASAHAPENTLAAFQLAAEMGADGIELDVQLTSDGEVVVIHDETLDRTSSGSGWVKDHTLAQLSELNCNLHQPELGAMRIPTLEEVYRLVAPTGMTVNVELKNSVVFYEGLEEKVLALTKRFGMEERVIYSSFNHYSVRRLRSLNPAVRTGVLYDCGIVDAPFYAKNVLYADAVHPPVYGVAYPDYMLSCAQHGLSVHVWTVNEEADMRALCQAGVDALITNDPPLALRVAAEYNRK